jgi:uncharacterized protein (DUF1499 family)
MNMNAEVTMRPVLAIVVLSVLAGCAPTSHVTTGPAGERTFTPCGHAPRCAVSLEAPGPGGDAVAPLVAGSDAASAHANLLAVLRGQPGYEILEDDGRYVHAQYTTRLMRYGDDVEFLIRDDGTVDVRSASRIGWYDWETNRERIEALRNALATRNE